MKLSLILLFLFLTGKYSFAQNDYGYGNDKEIIKTTKVKTLTIYYFLSKSDSILTHINIYDSIGGQLSSKMFSKDGTISRSDTFIYDANHYLVKQITSDGNQKRHESTFTNNSYGKILNQTTIGDSIYYHSIIIYDENGRVIRSIIYDDKGDTTLHNTFYNRKGFIAKYVISNKLNGTTVIKFDYNSSGKITKRKSVDPKTQYFAEFKYKSNGNCYEVTTTTTSNKQKSVTKLIYSYYSNGLTYEKFIFVNDKPIGLERTYYTYY